MGLRLDSQTALRLLRLSGKLTAIWPTESSSTRLQIYVQESTWWMTVSNFTLLFVSVTFDAYYSPYDPFVVARTLAELMILADALIHVLLFRIQYPRLQMLIREVWHFFHNSNIREEVIIHKYFKRYTPVHIFVVSAYVFGVISFSISPFTMSKTIPVESWYPFRIDSPIVTCFVYLHQVVAVLQTTVLFTGDLMIITFIRYATTRLELLREDFSHVSNEREFRSCVRAHQRLIWFVTQIQSAMSSVLLKTVIAIFVIIISGSFQLIREDAMTVTSQYYMIIFVASLRLFCVAWAATDLTEVAHNIAWSVYNSQWINVMPKMKKNVMIVVMRCQKSLLITFKGAVVLSLDYVGSIYYMTITYFMTLKAIIDD